MGIFDFLKRKRLPVSANSLKPEFRFRPNIRTRGGGSRIQDKIETSQTRGDVKRKWSLSGILGLRGNVPKLHQFQNFSNPNTNPNAQLQIRKQGRRMLRR